MVRAAPDAAAITAVVLAGGAGSRVGHADKGLVLARGYPLIMHVLMRVAPQVGPVIISANRNLASYEALGHQVVADDLPGYAGPLAGIAAALRVCQSPYLLCVPCDAPRLSLELAARLGKKLVADSATIAAPFAEGRRQAAFCLMRADLGKQLSEFITAGGRKLGAWQDSLGCIEVAFDDQAQSFTNINSLEDLRAFEACSD